MRLAILLAGAVLASCSVTAGQPVKTSAADAAALDDALAGRVAGEPRSCVRQQDVRNSRSAGGDTILFDGPGGVVYANRTSGSCPRILPWHALSHRTSGTNMCAGELIRVFDPQSGVEYGGCSLGAFVPYRRVD